MPVFNNVLELIGDTPVVRINHLDTGPCELFIKLESQNPGGSIKDRIGLKMIEDAEAAGQISPGTTLVEGTAGNTGLGLALVAAQKGYRLVLVIPDKMSREKISNLKAMGAEVVLTRSDVAKGHPEYYQDLAKRLASEMDDAFFINQFGNPSNPKAHEEVTGPEIWEQMDGDLDAIVLGVGSSGTVTGLSRYFAREAPHLELVLADPEGSILAEYINEGTPVHQEQQLAGGRHRRRFSAHDQRLHPGQQGLCDQRPGELPGGPRIAGSRGHPRRFVDRHAGGRGAAVLPRTDRRPSGC